mgnify:FL=1
MISSATFSHELVWYLLSLNLMDNFVCHACVLIFVGGLFCL